MNTTRKITQRKDKVYSSAAMLFEVGVSGESSNDRERVAKGRIGQHTTTSKPEKKQDVVEVFGRDDEVIY